MTKYDPDQAPDVAAWLALDEGDRVALVQAYHQQHGIALPNERLHAAIHVVVENQLAIPERDVVDALDRLQRQGLSRHDAVHAIGALVSEQIAAALNPAASNDPAGSYLARVRRLSADWRAR